MFGNSSFKPFFGPDGRTTMVQPSGANSFIASAPGEQPGFYTKIGSSLIAGPDGVSTVLGTGPIKTVVSPTGRTRTVIDNGPFGTIL